MADRIPPHNKEAEQAVLGAAMLNNDALAGVTAVVRPDDFYDSANKEIYTVILELFAQDKAVDIITVTDELRKRGSLELAGGQSYVASLPSLAPTSANAAGYAEIVRDKASLRRLIVAADDIKDKSFDGGLEPNQIIDYAEQSIFEIAQKKQDRDYEPIKDVIIRDIQLIDDIIRAKGRMTGVPSGFKDLDDVTLGFQKSDLVIIAARPAMGKSSFALNIALNASKKAGARVMLFSLEMSKEQLGLRLLSMESGMSLMKLRSGEIEHNEWGDISLAQDSLSRRVINIDDTPGIGIMEIKNKCRRMKRETGLDLIIIDYLQLMEVEGRIESRQQEISKLSRQLKLLARELDCPAIVLSQLSRAPELRQDKRPILSDLRESGSIEQDADMVIFLYRDEYYDPESDKAGICEINLAKHRNGETKKIELAWIKDKTQFGNYSRAVPESGA